MLKKTLFKEDYYDGCFAVGERDWAQVWIQQGKLGIDSILWHCLSLGLEWKLTFSRPVLSFPDLLAYECSTFTASSFRIWNSSTGIPSPPLALYVVIRPKPTWLHIPGRLALGEWSHHRGYLSHEDLFLYSSFVYSCHLFLISSASVRSIPFLSFMEPIFAWNVPLLLLLLLSRFSRVRLCATPETAAHQAPVPLGFFRQEHWIGLPFPSPIHKSEKWKWSRTVVSDS